mmetsp:Transcript_29010/g.94528  ORF Transcript_29010/g.94528 Transcript_29010/m.94528 type:complete len:229 (-) Transcript_29010:46-732(-)
MAACLPPSRWCQSFPLARRLVPAQSIVECDDIPSPAHNGDRRRQCAFALARSCVANHAKVRTWTRAGTGARILHPCGTPVGGQPHVSQAEHVRVQAKQERQAAPSERNQRVPRAPLPRRTRHHQLPRRATIHRAVHVAHRRILNVATGNDDGARCRQRSGTERRPRAPRSVAGHQVPRRPTVQAGPHRRQRIIAAVEATQDEQATIRQHQACMIHDAAPRPFLKGQRP